jgi:hypothetical protein
MTRQEKIESIMWEQRGKAEDLEARICYADSTERPSLMFGAAIHSATAALLAALVAEDDEVKQDAGS